jgi:hypothetical protein
VTTSSGRVREVVGARVVEEFPQVREGCGSVMVGMVSVGEQYSVRYEVSSSGGNADHVC